jgi:hypothetical protein
MTTPTEYSPDPTLTPQQHRIVSLLAAGQSITQAADSENLHRNTIANWRRTIPAFARELEFAQREQRQYWHEQATRLAPQAIQAIEDCLTNPNSSPSLRFRAATLIVKLLTDPNTQSLKNHSPIPAELAAIDDQPRGFRKQMAAQNAQSCTAPPADAPEDIFDIAESARISVQHAQNCTKPQPIRVTPQPGRNAPCPCNSGQKYKRCCANHPKAA